jgi:hypothetical protein
MDFCSPSIPASVHVEKKKKVLTHVAHETPPTPLASQRLHSSDTIPDALLARLTFWQPKSHMAGLAIRVSLVHREANIVVDELAVAREVQLARARNGRRKRTGWRKEWVPAFSTEKVLFVVSTCTKGRIVERDEPFVDDGRLAVEATRSKRLFESYTDAHQSSSKRNDTIQTS